MLPPNGILSTFVRVERGKEGATVELEGGQKARLDPSDERWQGFANVLEGLAKLRRPVYVELEGDAIARVLIPEVGQVIGVRKLDEGVMAVDLRPSHARHVLRERTEAFEEILARLRRALDTAEPMIVVEDDAHEIIDVREYRPAPGGPDLPFPEPGPRPRPRWPWRWLRELWWWRWWPWWWWFRCVSADRAQEIFDAMSATTCDPHTVPAPCIPFLYPDDGCWGRAHEMCRLMIGMGVRPRKVWIQGSLYAPTRNHPNCGVHWGWHVAPTICVRGRRPWRHREMVIDPSLFTTPVTQATWKGAQGDPNASLTPSAASIFYLWGNQTDPNYTQTDQVLATYRLALQNRTVQQGPPPYANCP
jgi:hypothetical protein